MKMLMVVGIGSGKKWYYVAEVVIVINVIGVVHVVVMMMMMTLVNIY